MPGNLIAQDLQATKRKIVAGVHTTVTATDAVTFSQFTTVETVHLQIAQDVADAIMYASYTKSGNVVTIKTWKTTGSDPTPVAADAFDVSVAYIVTGY